MDLPQTLPQKREKVFKVETMKTVFFLLQTQFSPPNPDQAWSRDKAYLISEAIILQINPEEDIIARIRSFYEQATDDLRIRSAIGVISSVVIGNAVFPVLRTFEGMFEILSLTGSFGANENGIVTVSFANNEGHVFGGRVVSEMIASTAVTVELCRLLRKVNEEPCGYYFNPTEEDLINHYLLKKISGERTDVELKVIDLLTVEPSDIPNLCKVSGKETSQWYFYTQKDKTYLSGIAGTNRSTAEGNWRTTGNDKEIYSDLGVLIGMRKTLIFYQGKSSSKKITEWSIHEYRAQSTENEGSWIICKLFRSQRKTKADRPRLPLGALNIRGDQPVQQQVSQGPEFSVFDQIPFHQPLDQLQGPGYDVLNQLSSNQSLHQDQVNPMVHSLIDPEWMPFHQSLYQLPGQEDQIPPHQPLDHSQGPGYHGFNLISSNQPLHQDELTQDQLNQMVDSLINPEWMPSDQALYQFPAQADAPAQDDALLNQAEHDGLNQAEHEGLNQAEQDGLNQIVNSFSDP